MDFTQNKFANQLPENISTNILIKTKEVNIDKVWGFLKTMLSQQMKIEHYKAWVENSAKLVKYQQEDSTALVAVVNSYVKNWLENNAGIIFEQVLTEIFGNKVKVDFLVKEDIFEIFLNKESKRVEPLLDPIKNKQAQFQQSALVSKLNPKYKIENFIIGPNNQLAFTAIDAVINSSGSLYNPLFIYGSVGIGKTHLLQAAGLDMLAKDPQKKVYYCSFEHFFTEYIESMRKRNITELHNKFRNLDLLLLDDVQFISNYGKESTQNELFHTFNILYEQGKQIILASDRKPDQIDKLVDRLRSRFEGGMVLDILPPPFETRIAILQKKAELNKSNLSYNTISLIAELTTDNVRELEGAFNKINTLASLSNFNEQDITKEYLIKLLGKSNYVDLKIPTVKQIIESVCENFNLNIKDIKSNKREKSVALPRQVIMLLLRQELSLSYQEIAKSLDRKDHTTIMYGIKRMTNLLSKDKDLSDKIQAIKKAYKK